MYDLEVTLKVYQGQRSRCTFINWAMVNNFVYRHHGPRSNRLDAMLDFHFRDLEMTPSRSSTDNGVSASGLAVKKVAYSKVPFFLLSDASFLR